MVVGLPSAEVTSFRMVPAGRGPFVWKERCILCHPFEETRLVPVLGVLSCLLFFFPALMQIADLYDLCERVSGSLACDS